MGAAVSDWRLAKAVSSFGQLGVVSGTAIDLVLARRLQRGDYGGHCRRALEAFPFGETAERILNTYYVVGGISENQPFKSVPMHTYEGSRRAQELAVAANFVEVYLAREGHGNAVGINYLEKIQLPHLPSLYGAMLAGVDYVIMGAGIPLEIPGALDALSENRPASYPLRVTGAKHGEVFRLHFDPSALFEVPLPQLKRPNFLPIIASDTLAVMLTRKANGRIDGFVIEGPTAGGHNAPPRGALKLTDDGQPIYGERDIVNLETMRELGLPFWLAGSYGTAQRLQEAFNLGAAGIQVGTPFALCAESGLCTSVRRALMAKAVKGAASVFTDPCASPAGFPFKVAQLEDTLSDNEVYESRERLCDLGYLREAYRKDDGTVGFRCPGEPVHAYVKKGGKPEDAIGKKCLCNGLSADIGLGQYRGDGTYEQPLVTLGDDYINAARFCHNGSTDFSAADVLEKLLCTVRY
ncbi:MAG: nitronate monooxygenase [Candidatus Hydrogenedentes bacterium]|nr:nitronate monooxygenase [Candidatus Hydrogenedentota bacterium]